MSAPTVYWDTLAKNDPTYIKAVSGKSDPSSPAAIQRVARAHALMLEGLGESPGRAAPQLVGTRAMNAWHDAKVELNNFIDSVEEEELLPLHINNNKYFGVGDMNWASYGQKSGGLDYTALNKFRSLWSTVKSHFSTICVTLGINPGLACQQLAMNLLNLQLRREGWNATVGQNNALTWVATGTWTDKRWATAIKYSNTLFGHGGYFPAATFATEQAHLMDAVVGPGRYSRSKKRRYY
jgi:hypothetical protein